MIATLVPYLLAALWVGVLGVVGKEVTALGPWYRALRKPPWQPPDFLFPVAWTSIFLMAGIAFVQAWHGAEAEPGMRRWLVLAWIVNGILNTTWSFLFFRLRRPDWAILEIGLLLPSIVLMMVVTASVRPAAIWWLMPYLLWVSFATFLNRAIITRNAPFDR